MEFIKSDTKIFVKFFRQAGKNWRGSRGGKFLPASRQQNCFAILRQSASGFCSKKVLTSSNKHHHIKLAASLGASPLALATNSIWWCLLDEIRTFFEQNPEDFAD